MTSNRTGRAARLLGSARQLWLYFGVALLILMLAEGCYRTQGWVRRSVGRAAGDPPPAHPYADTPWYAEYAEEEERSMNLRWRSYVYFRRAPFEGRHLNVDGLGHRRTVQPRPGRGDSLEVFFFGGSTMFGSFQRDAGTIPSRIAHRIESLGDAAPSHAVLTNFGETGWVFTQSTIELELQLREGARPDVVVFYDGINDVAAAVQNRRGGLPQNEGNRATDFALGRVLFNWRRDIGAEVRAASALAGVVARRLQLIERMRPSAAPAGGAASADSISAEVASSYVETARLVESLANDYGFTALYVWQPNFHAGAKALAPFERLLLQELEAQPFQRQIREVHRRVPGLIERPMKELVGSRFLDLSMLFAGDSMPVYVDVIGHTTEAAADRIAAGLWQALLPVLWESDGVPGTAHGDARSTSYVVSGSIR